MLLPNINYVSNNIQRNQAGLVDRDPDAARQPDRRASMRVEHTRDPNPITHSTSLQLTCSPDAQDAYPDRLFFKHSSRAVEAKLY
jgi:hypothetical protein